MPLFFVIIGALLVAAGVNDKTKELGDLVKGDFTSSNGIPSFTVWLLAFFLIGAVGYVKSLRPVSIAFLTLVIITMLLANDKQGTGTFFDKFLSAIKGS